MRTLSLMLCLLLPTAALAEEVSAPPPADQPTQPSLAPQDAAPATPDAVDNAWRCGMHGGCAGRGKAKWIVITGVTATVLTAVAIGVAVGVSRANANTVPVTP